MHGYYWDRVRLKNKLAAFTSGQFLIETKLQDEERLVFRGDVKVWDIPDMSKRRIVVYFDQLWEQRFGWDASISRRVSKWVSINPLSMEVDYRYYYFQRERQDRLERIKLWTPIGEVCRCFRLGDPSNLKQEGGVFLPLYRPPKPDSVSNPED